MLTFLEVVSLYEKKLLNLIDLARQKVAENLFEAGQLLGTVMSAKYKYFLVIGSYLYKIIIV